MCTYKHCALVPGVLCVHAVHDVFEPCGQNVHVCVCVCAQGSVTCVHVCVRVCVLL